jgi:hypothetical protein
MKKIIIFLALVIIFITSLVEARSKSSSGYSAKSYSSKSYSVKKGYVQRPVYTKPSPTKPVYVKGYHTNKGKWVEGHYKTVPNKTVRDNWDTRPNVNPYTGKPGTKDPNRTKQ